MVDVLTLWWLSFHNIYIKSLYTFNVHSVMCHLYLQKLEEKGSSPACCWVQHEIQCWCCWSFDVRFVSIFPDPPLSASLSVFGNLLPIFLEHPPPLILWQRTFLATTQQGSSCRTLSAVSDYMVKTSSWNLLFYCNPFHLLFFFSILKAPFQSN